MAPIAFIYLYLSLFSPSLRILEIVENLHTTSQNDYIFKNEPPDASLANPSCYSTDERWAQAGREGTEVWGRDVITPANRHDPATE